MLTEGVPAAMIENVGRMAGMPVGPLSLNDEVAVDLAWKILKATEADLGAKAIDARQKALLEEMVEKRGRYGRKNAKGFYDYPQTGPKRLWPGLAELQKAKLDPDTIDVTELKQRLLAIQALETARCFEENVLTDVREADVGSILGFGYAPYSGGTLSYIDMMGTKAFVALCESSRRNTASASSRTSCWSKWPRRARASTRASRRSGRSRRRNAAFAGPVRGLAPRGGGSAAYKWRASMRASFSDRSRDPGARGQTPAFAQDKPVQLRFSHWVPTAHPMHVAAVAWAESIEKASNGSIKIAIFPPSSSARHSITTTWRATASRISAHVNPGYEPGRFPIVGAVELPFMFSNAKEGSARARCVVSPLCRARDEGCALLPRLRA